MKRRDEFDLKPAEKELLRAWRTLFEEHYTEDIKRFQGLNDDVCGFEVAHALIDNSKILKTPFHLEPTRTLEIGNHVLKEQFDLHEARMRPIIRVVGFHERYLRRVDTLRMRDRGTLVSLDVKINDISNPYGWLRVAVYECQRCSTRYELPQRRARERESPRICETCLNNLELSQFKDNDDDASFPPFFGALTNFKMLIEDCKYEDVQDLSLCQVVFNKQFHVLNCSLKQQIVGTLTDDLVGELEPGTYMRINGIVTVEPVPERTFAKDTRRILAIDVLSVEPLALKE